MSEGAAHPFLPIARKIEHSTVWEMGPLAIQLWLWLLLKAVWKPEGFTMWNGIHLERGQLWTTYDLMREGLRVRKGRGYALPASTTLKDIITRLKADRMVDLKADRNGLVITICKYDEYNPLELESRPNSRPQRNRLADPEVQREEQVPPHPAPPTARAYDCEWTRAILEDWKSVHELPSNASEQACLKVIHDLHRIDKKSPETITTVCAFIVRNKVPQFIKSPMKLRQKTRTGDQQTFEMYEWEVGKKAPPQPQRERKTLRQIAAEKNARQRAALEEAGINAPNR